MRKNKLTHLLEPSLRLYFVFLLLFAAVSALFSVAVAVIEAAVVAVLYLYFRRSNAQRQKEIILNTSAKTCMVPQGPTRIGPRRHWNAAQTFRSMNIIMIAITA